MAIPLALIPLIAQGALGAGQMIAGRNKMRGDRPQLQIEEEQKKELAIAKAAYSDKSMPGQSDAINANLLAQANSVAANAAATTNNAAISAVQAASEKANRDLAVQVAQFQRADEAAYSNSLIRMAAAKNQQFMANEFAPYAERQQEGRDMFGAGLQNLGGALNTGAAAGLSSLLYGSNASKTSTPKIPIGALDLTNLPTDDRSGGFFRLLKNKREYGNVVPMVDWGSYPEN